MSTDRFDLPPTRDGREQFAIIERDPSREQLKAIERHGRQALRSDQSMDGEDWMIVTLCEDWTVYDRAGNPVPLRTGKAFDQIPGYVLAPLVRELEAVIAGVDRGNAMSQVTAVVRNLAALLPDDGAKRVDDLLAELHETFGVTPPNRETQES